MVQWRYRRIRRWLIYGLIASSIALVCTLLYKEWTAPIAQLPTTISSHPPAAIPAPPAQAKANYSVPPTYPRWLTIAKIGVSAAIQAVGVTNDGAIDAPKTAWEAGWYSSSGLPGEQAAMVIDGHVNDSFNTAGIFWQLHKLAPDDTIEVERGDGVTFNYRVVSAEQQSLEKINMARLLQPVTLSKPGLNLVTCGGKYDPKRNTYSDRILVFAEQQ